MPTTRTLTHYHGDPPTSHENLQDNTVELSGDVLYITLRGKQTGELARKTLAAFKTQLATCQSSSKKVFVLVNYKELKVSDVTSEARLAIKEAFGQHYEALAAIGNNRLAEVAMYLISAGGAKDRARHFTSEKKALCWLEEVRHPQKKRGNLLLITSMLTGSIGWLGLIGWWIGNQYLIRFITDLRPINPMGAVGLAILGLALGFSWRDRKRLAAASAILLICLGIAALLPIDIDYLLFADKVRAAGPHVRLADSAAICFIAAGISILVVRLASRLAILTRTILASIITTLAVCNLFGIMYARDALYGISPNFAMAFSLALALTICGSGLMIITASSSRGDALARIGKMGWLIMAVLVTVQITTYASWQQSIKRNETDTHRAFDLRAKEVATEIQDRVRAYVDALYGFRALFAASDSVGAGEFDTYYNSLRLSEKYPGFRAVSFISVVDSKRLPDFTAQKQRDTSKNTAGNLSFAIQQPAKADTHYILTYLANNTTSTALGRDFTDVPVRKTAYSKAVASGTPTVSDTIIFEANATQKASKGFFITIPVERHTDQAGFTSGNYEGLVNAVFNYNDFFANVFTTSSADMLQDINLAVIDTTAKNQLFAKNDVKEETHFVYDQRIAVADRTWDIVVKAANSFGSSESQATLPRAILTGGQAASVLLVAVFWIQNRARQRALKLADDITVDLQYERNQAVSTQQKDDAILSSIGDAVFAIDTHKKITVFNPSAEALSGYSREQALGKPYTDILRFEFESGGINDQFIKKALSGHVASMQSQTILIARSGRRIPVADSAAPIRDLNGTLQGAIVVFRDVSKESELDRAKTEFVSLASHQLRTPLSAINWYAEMLLHGDAGVLKKEQKNYIQEIFDGNQRMVELVNSLLDVSRLDLGKLTSTPSENDSLSLIASLEKELTASITGKNITISHDFGKALPVIVADSKLLRMILQNLLSNAVKYTAENGSIAITARAATSKEIAGAGLKDVQPYFFFSVSDTGFGIPVAQQDKIFSKLFRADNVRVLDVEGTGLGLYIVKEVVEKLGGRVWFVSREGVGSTFYVILPFTTKEQANKDK